MVKPRYISAMLHILVWTAILLLPFLLKMPAQNKAGFLNYPALYFDITNLLNAGLFYFNAFFLTPRLFKRKKWFFYSFCIILMFFLLFSAKIMTLKLWFSSVELDEWAYRFALFSTAGLILISALFGVTVITVKLEKEQKVILAERAITELKLFRSQISPHFLFNVLSTLIALNRKKSDRLEPSLIMVSELIRYMLYEANENRVSIAKEIEYLRYYMQLQQLRFGHDDVKIETQLPVLDGESNLTIEPMLLIPFVENAFKHGIGCVPDPSIKINLFIDNAILYFTVENKFAPVLTGSDEASSGIGLSNITSRLKLLYGGKYQLNIIKGNSTFHLKLKLELK